ncbi:MAG: DUF6538 domain-containing protein [Thermohalobaculum sp.]
MSHNPSHNRSHIIVRNGSFVFNRRVPKAVQSGFGSQFVRVRLGQNQDRAELLASKLTKKLDEIWASPSVQPLDVSHSPHVRGYIIEILLRNIMEVL